MSCVKCGCTCVHVRYNRGDMHLIGQGNPEHVRTAEHLDFRCEQCGYEWEDDCADAQERDVTTCANRSARGECIDPSLFCNVRLGGHHAEHMAQARMWLETSEVIAKIGSELECGFVESIEDRAKREALTAKQQEILERLYRRACASPY